MQNYDRVEIPEENDTSYLVASRSFANKSVNDRDGAAYAHRKPAACSCLEQSRVSVRSRARSCALLTILPIFFPYLRANVPFPFRTLRYIRRRGKRKERSRIVRAPRAIIGIDDFTHGSKTSFSSSLFFSFSSLPFPPRPFFARGYHLLRSCTTTGRLRSTKAKTGRIRERRSPVRSPRRFILAARIGR